MFASILSCILPLVHSGADVSVRVQMAPGISIVYHNDSYYREREAERQRERDRLQADREREEHEHELWEHRKPGDHWRDSPWHDRRDEWERERAERLRFQREHENARLARIHFMEVEEARDREERRIALERRLIEERRDEDRRRDVELRREDAERNGPVRGDAKIHDEGRGDDHRRRSIND